MERNSKGQFVNGISPDNRVPVGTVHIRTRYKRRGEKRAWVKVAEPNVWRLYAHVIWETLHGEIPIKMGVHHIDHNTLNDTPENLMLMSKRDHLVHHQGEFEARRIASSTRTRRQQRWSTKSKTKRTGRHPKICNCPLHIT